MTEAEWLACNDPGPMLKWLVDNGSVSQRKLRLLVCACGRRVEHLMDDESFKVVQEAENIDDSQSNSRSQETAHGVFFLFDYGPQLLRAVRARSQDVSTGYDFWNVNGSLGSALYLAANYVAENDGEFLQAAAKALVTAPNHNPRWAIGIARTRYEEITHQAILSERAAQAETLRCIFGNPFRSSAFDPSCLTAKAVRLAQTIDQERAFDSLSILADLLDDAGYTNQEILSHCRQEGEHVRGCWVVDLILGKK